MENQSESKNEEKTGETRVWVVVVTKPSQERKARYELERQGFETYLPMKLSMNRRTQQMVAAPFFPRYLFAKVSLDFGDWRKVWYTYGVHGLLGTADRPVGVKDIFIERIRAQEEAGYIKMGLEAHGPTFEKGQAVTVDEWGLNAIFQQLVDDKRALLLVSFMGRDSRFVVDLRKLRSTGG